MKRVINFHKAYPATIALSLVLITAGIVGYFVLGGFNLGVDFKAGSNETVQVAYPVAEISYSGLGTLTMNITARDINLVYSGAEVESKSVQLSFKDHATLGSLAQAIQAQASDVAVNLSGASDLGCENLVPSYLGNFVLTSTPSRIYRKALPADQASSVDKVRAALADLGDTTIQVVNDPALQQYSIRVQDLGKDPNFAKNVTGYVIERMEKVYGDNNVISMSSDSVGAASSTDMAKTSALLIVATLLVILVYSVVRFKFQYGIGAVLATAHDALIMIAFIVWFRMEFNVMTIAAILTILGFSINDTIVVFDRVRETRKLLPNESMDVVVNTANTETLGRTFITTITTMLAAFSLFFFTTGAVHNFALALIVGMVSGTYSTIFIANAFIVWWDRAAKKSAIRKEKRNADKGRKLVDEKKARRDAKSAPAKA